jgi:ubiquinone/menaquinone biosynthesis C-methylase UbiE
MMTTGLQRRMNICHSWICRSNHWRKTLEQRIPWVLAEADLGAEPLEIGPGPGLTTEALSHRFARLTALEIDPAASDALRARLRNINVEVVTGDAASMPFPDQRFSGAVMFTMLHHVPSPELQDQVLREVWRVLKPGGIFVGSDSMRSLLMRVIHIGDTYVPVDPGGLSDRLAAAGFEVCAVERETHSFRFHARRPA